MKLPEHLRTVFWDCDFDAIDVDRDTDFVIGRVLVSGTWDAIRWLRRHVGDAAIRDHIVRHRGRALGSEQIRLWEILVRLPPDAVTEWLAAPERRLWEQPDVA